VARGAGTSGVGAKGTYMGELKIVTEKHAESRLFSSTAG
jgi:hypothetical protein